MRIGLLGLNWIRAKDQAARSFQSFTGRFRLSVFVSVVLVGVFCAIGCKSWQQRRGDAVRAPGRRAAGGGYPLCAVSFNFVKILGGGMV